MVHGAQGGNPPIWITGFLKSANKAGDNMQFKNANQAGLVTPAHLPTVSDPSRGSGGLLQEKATGALQGTTVAIENQHPDFASLEQSTPALKTTIKAKLIGWASWLAIVFKGVA